MADRGEIGADDLAPTLIARAFRRPVAVGDIGGLVDGKARLGAVVIVSMGNVGPADRGGVVLGVKAVGAFQVVMRMLEAKLDQMPPRGVGPAQKVDGVLRDGEIVERMVLCPIVIGMVDALDARTPVQIGLDPGAGAAVLGGHILMKQHAAIAFWHRAVGGIHLAGGEIVEPRPAQVIGPGLFRRQNLAPEAVEIDQPGAERRQPGGEFRPTGRAEGDRRIGVAKAHPGVQQAVKVRGLDRNPEGVAPGEDVDHVIDPDDADVVPGDGVSRKAHQGPPSVSRSRAGSAQRRGVPSPHPSRSAPRLAG